MSLAASAWAFRQALPPAPKLVLLALADALNDEGYGFPGVRHLATCCAPMQVRAVQRHIRTLASLKLVRVIPQFNAIGKQTSNAYQLAMPGVDTTGWGEGVISDRGEGVIPARERVSQLGQGEGVTAVSPTEDLNPLLNDKSNCIVGLTPDSPHTLWAQAEALIGVLNTQSKRQFHARTPRGEPTAGLKAVHGLLRHGYTVVQVRGVIEDRVRRWLADPVMREYLRPETLFRVSKFESYLGQVAQASAAVAAVHRAAVPVPTPVRAVEVVECPDEVRAILGRLCGARSFSFSADSQGQA